MVRLYVGFWPFPAMRSTAAINPKHNPDKLTV